MSNLNPKPWPPLVQSLVKALLIGFFVLFSFTVVYSYLSQLAVASLAASAFIAFGFNPGNPAGRPRCMIGGYLCGLVGGAACNAAMAQLVAHMGHRATFYPWFCSLGVLLTCFLMLLFKVGHPPAAALAITMVIDKNPFMTGLMAFVCIVILSLLQWASNKLFGAYMGVPGPSRPDQEKTKP